MIIKRIADALREQNWFTVIIELVIVVAGILIAVQIDSWNEGRKNNQLEVQYVAELIEDIEADLVEVSEGKQSATLRRSAARYVLEEAGEFHPVKNWPFPDLKLPPAAPPLPDNFKNYVSLAFIYVRVLDGNNATFRQLVSSGELSLIKNRSLIRVVNSYYALYASTQDGEKQLVRPPTGDYADYIKSIRMDGFVPMTVAEFVVIAKANPQLVAEIKNVSNSANLHTVLLTELEDRATETLAVLRTYQAEIDQ